VLSNSTIWIFADSNTCVAMVTGFHNFTRKSSLALLWDCVALSSQESWFDLTTQPFNLNVPRHIEWMKQTWLYRIQIILNVLPSEQSLLAGRNGCIFFCDATDSLKGLEKVKNVQCCLCSILY